MRVHYINVQQTKDGESAGRNSAGGCPILLENQDWPKCIICKAQMVLFFQIDIWKEFDLPFKPGSHLLVFMCPIHNDSPSELIMADEIKLPNEYWNKDFGHYKLILNKNPKSERTLASETHIKPGKMILRDEEEEVEWDGAHERGTHGFKVGGVPAWEITPRTHRCCCGAEMIFVAQVPQFFKFPRTAEAPLQPDGREKNAYNLFLGKHTYIFACKEQCTPLSLYAVAQTTEQTVEEMSELALSNKPKAE